MDILMVLREKIVILNEETSKKNVLAKPYHFSSEHFDWLSPVESLQYLLIK